MLEFNLRNSVSRLRALTRTKGWVTMGFLESDGRVEPRAGVEPGRFPRSGHVPGTRDQAAAESVSVVVLAPDERTVGFIVAMFAGHSPVTVVATAIDHLRFESLVRDHEPRVVILASSPFTCTASGHPVEWTLPAMAGQLVAAVGEQAREAKVLVMNNQASPDVARALLEIGVDGIVGLEDGPRDVRNAVELLAGGSRYINPNLAARIFAPNGRGDGQLSDREREIVRLIALGFTNAECAEELFLSVRTIENHRSAVNRKLGFTSRRDLVAFALANHMVS